jgi:hypothetical protein
LALVRIAGYVSVSDCTVRARTKHAGHAHTNNSSPARSRCRAAHFSLSFHCHKIIYSRRLLIRRDPRPRRTYRRAIYFLFSRPRSSGGRKSVRLGWGLTDLVVFFKKKTLLNSWLIWLSEQAELIQLACEWVGSRQRTLSTAASRLRAGPVAVQIGPVVT